MMLLLACAQPVDADFDGFPVEQDCNDADAYVYPGAPDRAGDGWDADCDGIDPALPYLDTWTFTYFSASYSGIEILVAEKAGGTLTLSEDRVVDATVVTTLDPIIYGAPVEIQVLLAGAFSPLQSDTSLSLYAEGDNYDEQMHVAWDCELVTEDELSCVGELKALDLSLDADVVLVR